MQANRRGWQGAVVAEAAAAPGKSEEERQADVVCVRVWCLWIGSDHNSVAATHVEGYMSPVSRLCLRALLCDPARPPHQPLLPSSHVQRKAEARLAAFEEKHSELVRALAKYRQRMAARQRLGVGTLVASGIASSTASYTTQLIMDGRLSRGLWRDTSVAASPSGDMQREDSIESSFSSVAMEEGRRRGGAS
jgi:hypothetical protein